MHNLKKIIKVVLFFMNLFYGSSSYCMDSRALLSEELPTDSARVITPAGYGVAVRGGLPHQPRFDEHTGLPLLPTVSTPPAQLRFDARIGGGIEASGDAQVYVNSQITQHLIDNSKFKREYDCMSEHIKRSLDESGLIIEFEHLFKLYEANPDMAALYKGNFRSLGEGGILPSGKKYFAHPLAKELAADIEVNLSMKIIDRQVGSYMATPFCLLCACKNISIETYNYAKMLEEYKQCKYAYVDQSPHIKQLDAKIKTVEAYIEKANSESCTAASLCALVSAIAVSPFIAIGVILA